MIRKMRCKRADGWILRILVSAAILFLAAGVWLAFFSTSSKEGFTNFREKIFYTEDCDNDGVINGLDMCPCDKTERGSQANEGCPEDYKIRKDNKGKEDRTCLEKGCPKVT